MTHDGETTSSDPSGGSVSGLDDLITEAGQTHVIPPREDRRLLERLRDPRVLARARELLQSKDKAVRTQAILCIERIGFALHDQESAELLLHHADAANDKYEATTALDGLKGLAPPQPLPSDPLVRLVGRREWLVWQAAVQCLHLALPDLVEDALLDRLDSDRYGRVPVARELRYMRSDESVRALERLLEDATVDVRCVALDSLGERLGAGVIPYARQVAGGRRWEEKLAAEKWLAQFGEADDVQFMADRLRSVLSGKRMHEIFPPESSYLVSFLLRYQDHPEARSALDMIGRRVDRLPDSEREWLREHAPEVLR